MLEKTEDFEWSRSKRLSKRPEAVEEEPAEKPPGLAAAPLECAAVALAAPPAPKPSHVSAHARPRSAPVPQGSEDTDTVIGIHSLFDGTLRCESSLRIKGTALGEINCARSLVVEETATVKARIRAANATIGGTLRGSVVCDERLEVLATGKVSGELTAAVLIIQEGAFFEGRLKVKEREPDGLSKTRLGFFRIFASAARVFALLFAF